MGEDRTRDRPRDGLDRITTAEAARRLGITEGAVRKRAQRGTIPYERDEAGRLWVWLSPAATMRDSPRDGPRQSRGLSQGELVDELRDRLRFVERQLEAERNAHAEARRLLAGALDRIPQLEAPREATEDSETVEEGEEMAISVLRAELERVRKQAAANRERADTEREAALNLEEELEAEQSKGFWSRLFGG